MQKVTEQDVNDIIALASRLKAIRYIPARKTAFAIAVDGLAPSAKWLLTFCCWHCLFNSKYKGIREDRLIGLPSASVNSTTFDKFIKYLRRHADVSIPPSKELPTLQLLTGCDKMHKEFYGSLLTKSWITGLPMLEVQSLLDLDSITKETVYGEIEYLKTGLSDLTYPVSIRVVPKVSMKSCLLVREASYSSLLVQDESELFTTMDKPDWLATDLGLSTTPRFVLGGFIGKHSFHATDYFENWEEAAKYLKDEEVTYYDQRITELNEYLNRSMLISMSDMKSEFVESPEELEAILPVLLKDYAGDLLITDATSSKTGNAHRVLCASAIGTIEDFWVEGGEVKGVSVWFNGSLINCVYNFEGKEQALLTSSDAVRGRVFMFHAVTLKGTVRYIGGEIMWRKPRWRHKRLRGSDKWVEKCILCGDTRIKHSNNGMCVSCESNLSYYLRKHGVDQWIKPSAQMINKRTANSWSSHLLNSAKYKHKGLLLEADDVGQWKFKTTTET